MIKTITDYIAVNYFSWLYNNQKLYKKLNETNDVKYLRMIIKNGINYLSKNPINAEQLKRNGIVVINKLEYDYYSFNMCYIVEVIMKALVIISLGYYPAFETKDIEGENYHNTYFKHESCDDYYSVFDDLIKCQVPNLSWFIKNKEAKALNTIYNEFFVLKDEIKREYDSAYLNLNKKGRLIATVARGTDYIITKPSGHPIQADVDEVIKRIKSKLQEEDKIFLATEEKKILEKFKLHLGEDKVLTTDSIYYDDIYNLENKRINMYRSNRENDKFLQGYEYFRRVYILSKCDGLISSMSGACRAAQIMKCDTFKPSVVFNKGLYK